MPGWQIADGQCIIISFCQAQLNAGMADGRVSIKDFSQFWKCWIFTVFISLGNVTIIIDDFLFHQEIWMRCPLGIKTIKFLSD